MKLRVGQVIETTSPGMRYRILGMEYIPMHPLKSYSGFYRLRLARIYGRAKTKLKSPFYLDKAGNLIQIRGSDGKTYAKPRGLVKIS